MRHDEDIPNRLRAHWDRFCRRFGIDPDGAAKEVFALILARYGEGHRSYHGRRHPVLLLDELEALRRAHPDWFTDPEFDAAVEWAIWTHDIFYDAQAEDNEEKSAEFAIQYADVLGFSERVGLDAKRMVLATKHTMPPKEFGEQIVVDIDLSLLATPWDEFVRNSADIRQEYKHVPDEGWKVGRQNFVQGMLDRPYIYSLRYFNQRFEAIARANLKRSLTEQFAT